MSTLKLRILTRFPALVSVSAPLLLVKNGLSYAFSIDVASLAAQILSTANTWAANQLFAGSFGYGGAGTGGAVTQATNRTTGVTLNKPTGAITLFTAAGSATAASFTVTNSFVAATDCILLSVKSGTNKYNAFVTAVGAGSFEITFATTGGTASDAPVINFALIKAVAA